MEIVVGAGLALAVTWISTWIGFDRDRAFYPVVLVVIASYYALFAAIGGSSTALGVETMLFAGFCALAMIGFRTRLWVAVVALFAHGALDLVHGQVIDNPGVPAWWPMFCLAFDWTAASYIGWRILQQPTTAPRRAELHGFDARIAPHVARELQCSERAEQAGNLAASFRHLERAHVLGQSSTYEHVRVHVRMLRWAIGNGPAREAFGQVLRIAGAATMTPLGLIPTGNTGGSDISPFQRLPIPGDLSDIIASARSETTLRGLGSILLIGVLLICMPLPQAAAAPSTPTREAQVDGHRVAYQVLGTGGPAIVMISGLGDGMGSFRTAAAEMAKSTTVMIYDRPGYGASLPLSGPADAEGAARDLSGVLAQSGIKGPYVLIGHSLGGLYAEYYAAKHPHQIAGLVLEESRPADFTRRCEAAGIAMCTPTGFMARMLPRGAQDEVAGLATTLTQVEAAGPVHGARVLVMSRPVPAKASPMDALWKQSQSDLAGKYGGAVHLTAPGGGHYIHRDQRAWFVTTVLQFAGARITP